jgi:carboxyl-terminal processing protease
VIRRLAVPTACFLGWIAWAAVLPSKAQAPSSTTEASSSRPNSESGLEQPRGNSASVLEVDAQESAAAEAEFQKALGLERKRLWSSAMEVYEQALERWPARSEFRHRLRLCESHYKLGRRYQDPSFRSILLRMPREQALGLYDELLERIAEHYVEPVGAEPLVRRGLDNLEVALRDPWFLNTNRIQATPEQIKQVRDVLREHREQLAIHDRFAARREVDSCCQIMNRALGIRAAPVVLEFAYGASEALDAYSAYLSRDRLDDLYSMIDGNFVGLGVELKSEPRGLRLVGVIRGGPAWDAGLRTGDYIMAVENRPVADLGLDESANRLQGEAGTSVSITVAKAGGTTQTLSLTRRPVEVASVAQAELLDRASGLGYLQLSAFQKNTVEEVRDAVQKLHNQGMKYLVIDLRGNPGGLLNVAVEIADLFLDAGVIVTTRGRAANQSALYRAQPGNLGRMPIVLLIDHDSASASEILAGALQENQRAWVLGERSYGKGSVQSIFPLRSAPAGLKLTTAKFYSPRNRPYSEQGVEPDILSEIRARPKPDEVASPAATVEFGNPERDPVLQQAIRLVRQQSSSAG